MPANETTEWGVMEMTEPHNHGNTLPENQRHKGQILPCRSREFAEKVVENRADVNPLSPLAVVSRTVTVSPWTAIDSKVGV